MSADPITMFTIGNYAVGLDLSAGAILSTLGTAAMAGGQIFGGEADYSGYAYMAQAAQASADEAQAQADRDANTLLSDAKRQASLEREQRQRSRAIRKTAWGSSGTAMQGSPLLVFEGASAIDEMDIQEILLSGKREANAVRYRGRATADQKRAEAYGYAQTAVQKRTSGYMGALTSTLATAGRVYGG